MNIQTVAAYVFLFVNFGFFAIAHQCPLNQEFLTCGTACAPTCQNKPEFCTDNCISGCFCKKGYIRKFEAGPCIPESDCETVPNCKANEVFSNCSTLCPPTCNNDGPRICPLICLQGCICKEGFIREKTEGECIPEVGCKDVCKKYNRVYNECGTPCPGTCSEPIKKCEKRCVRGCFCKQGYVLHDETKECIKLEQCPLFT